MSTDLSPVNFSNSQDRFLDALYIGQAVTVDPRQRAKIVQTTSSATCALAEAYSVPFLWWNRIIANSTAVKGWHLTPSHYIEQDLTDVSLDK